MKRIWNENAFDGWGPINGGWTCSRWGRHVTRATLCDVRREHVHRTLGSCGGSQCERGMVRYSRIICETLTSSLVT